MRYGIGSCPVVSDDWVKHLMARLAAGATVWAMTLGLFFWILVLFAIIGGWVTSRPNCNPALKPWGWTFNLVLILLLGWQVFGPALHR